MTSASEGGVTQDKLILQLSEATHRLGTKYGRSYSYGFDVLVGIQVPQGDSILKYIYEDGTLETVGNYSHRKWCSIFLHIFKKALA
jgi:hypothetical protein